MAKLLYSGGVPKYTSLMRDEVNSQSIVRGSTGEISKNIQSFYFSVGPTQRWKPVFSTWCMRISITAVGGGQLASAANIAPALNFPLNCWQFMHFYAGGKKIDEISEHVAEVSSLRTRLERSKAWYDSMGKQQYWDSSFKLRQNTIISDAPDGNDALVIKASADITLVNGITFAVANNVTIANGALAGQSTITLAAGTLLGCDLSVGDQLIFLSATHGNQGATVRIKAISNDTQLQVSPRIAVNGVTPYVLGDINSIIDTASTSTLANMNVLPVYNGKDTIEIQFRLPLGIEYLDEMPPGDYEYRFRGFSYSEFSKRIIESLAADKVIGANFELNVIDMYYYPYLVETDSRIDDTVIVKTIKCYEAQKRKVLSNSNQLQFTIKGNASALGFAIQDSRIGNDSQYSPGKMVSYTLAGPDAGGNPMLNRIDTQLSYYQIRYAGRYLPEPAQQDEFSGRVNRLVQSYQDTHKNGGGFFYEGGVETYDDFLTRGPFYFWQFPRDKNSYATEARVDIRFNNAVNANDLNNANCLFFFCYYKTIRMTISNGKIVAVDQSM